MRYDWDAVKVFLVSDFAHNDGGASGVVADLADGLSEFGVDVVVLAGAGPVGRNWQHLDVRLLDDKALGSGSLKSPSRLCRGVWSRRAERFVVDQVGSRSDTDAIVHVHTWTKVLSPSIFSAIKSTGAASITTLHDYFSICPNGALYNFPAEAICHLAPGGARCALSNCDSRNFGVKVYRTVRNASQQMSAGGPLGSDGVVFVSDFSKGVIERTHLHSLCTVIESPARRVDAKGTVRPVAERRLFLGAGLLSPAKGFGDLATAAQALDSPWEIVILGEGPQRDAIAQANPAIALPGWVSPESVAEWMKRARVLVSPSRMYETYGLVVDEALSNGLPCIVSDATAASERIRRSGAGTTYKSGDVESLKEALLKATDDQWIQTASARAVASMDAKPSREQWVQDTLDFYERVLVQRA